MFKSVGICWNLLESLLFPRHFHVLYIRKLQLKKIYGIYDTTDNNNRANRYANYVKYNINNNNDINNRNIIKIMCVLFGRYGIFGRYVIYDWSINFCRFQRVNFDKYKILISIKF